MEKAKSAHLDAEQSLSFSRRSDRLRIAELLVKKKLGDPRILGYRGVGIEDVLLMVENGFLPGSEWGSASYPPGSLHFGIRRDKLHLVDDLVDEDAAGFDPVEIAQGYAKDTAILQQLSSSYGIGRRRKKYSSMIQEIMSIGGKSSVQHWRNLQTWFPNMYRVLGVTRAELLRSLSQAARWQGVVVGVDEKILKDFKASSGDDGLSIYVSCPRGLPMQYVRGMQIMGPYERARFLAYKRAVTED